MIWTDPMLIKLSGRRQNVAKGTDLDCFYGFTFEPNCSEGQNAVRCSMGITARDRCAQGAGGVDPGCVIGGDYYEY